MKLGILKSTTTPLVAVVPATITKYQKDGFSVFVESGSGMGSHYADEAYVQAGATLTDREELLKTCDLILVDDTLDATDLGALKPEAMVIGKFNILASGQTPQHLSSSDHLIFSLDLVPRSSIAQSMDVLSSLASLSGYKAVISAAERFPGYFPMMTTAAGTVPPAKVLILGAGVAGLQAIATAKRLGASVEAFDVRSAVKEEVESLGAKFVEVEGAQEDLGAGGYAVTQSEDYIRKQQALIHEKASKADVVITTANIPGKQAPLLIESATVRAMRAGSVIIDMASATGGNCQLSKDGEEVQEGGVSIVGDSYLFHQLPKEASRLYSNNLYNFIKFILKEGKESIPYDHQIVQKTLLTASVSAEA